MQRQPSLREDDTLADCERALMEASLKRLASIAGLPSRSSHPKQSKIPVSPRVPVQYPSSGQIKKALRTKYQYNTLTRDDDIRLMTVTFSHGDTGLLSCNLEPIPMSDLVGSHTYEVVSYVWGSSALVEKVLCDDCSSHLDVTKNLREVVGKLVLLNFEFSRRQWWIDGLCINQEDAMERNSQVQKMTNIYRRAERVHIFLGAFNDEDAFLDSTWFTRRWIIQEAIAARRVTIHYRVDGSWFSFDSWDNLMAKTASLLGRDEFRQHPAAALLHDLYDATRTRWSGIFPLLLKFRSAQCIDDRDRLFALLGVSNDVEAPHRAAQVPSHLAKFQALKIWYSPDYSLSTDETYRLFALAALRSPFAFDLLHCAAAFRQPNGQVSRTLPTWVSDWRCPLLYKPLLRASHCQPGLPRRRGEESVRVDDIAWCLTVQGIALGTVQNISCRPAGLSESFVKVDWIRPTSGETEDEANCGIDLTIDGIL